MGIAETLRLRQGQPTRRVTLTANGRVFDTWTALRLPRDLADLASGATLEFYDVARAGRAFGAQSYAVQSWLALEAGQTAVLALDGEDVLRGRIMGVKLRASPDEIGATLTILDSTADLVDCAAAVPGQPHEYRNLTLTQFAQKILAPYGRNVRADVDVGAVFPRLSIEHGERALVAIEKYARQRSVLVTSDGLGALIITRGGHSPAPAPLRLGEGVVEMEWSDDWSGRHSETYVVGQGAPAARPARLNTEYRDAPQPVAPLAVERAAITRSGKATDPEITCYRPVVYMAKTHTVGATLQEQAEWRQRVARGKGQQHQVTTPDWRAGPASDLWRPNQRALVDDLYSGVLEERLIGALTYEYGPDGALTKLEVVRPGAYDLDPAARENRRSQKPAQRLNTEYR